LAFVFAIGMGSPAWGLMVANGSFEGTAPNFAENIDGWDGTHDETMGAGNVFGVLLGDGTYAPETPYGDNWAFISYDDGYATSVPGWPGVTCAIWTKIGTVEDNTDYTFSFLAGKGPSGGDYIDNWFDVSIWAGDASGPQADLKYVTLSSPDGPGQTQEHEITLNSGSGHAGEDLYLMFDIYDAGVWCQILIDNVQVAGGVEPGEFTVTETDDMTEVSEDGPTSDTYQISMSKAPDAAVTVEIGDESGQVSVEPNQVTFMPADWSAKTITVTAVDNNDWDGDPHTATISHQVSTTGTLYGFAAVADVSVVIQENDAFCDPDKLLPGDINGDCEVNFKDFAIMSGFWLDCSFTNVPGCIEFCEPRDGVVNSSFEEPEGPIMEVITDWEGTHDNSGNGWNNVYFTLPSGQWGMPTTPYGAQWGVVSWDEPYATSVPGVPGVTTGIWTRIGTVSDGTDYEISWLEGVDDGNPGSWGAPYDVSIWAGSCSEPLARLAVETITKGGQGSTTERIATLNSGSGHWGEQLWVMFSMTDLAEWSNCIVDNVQVVPAGP